MNSSDDGIPGAVARFFRHPAVQEVAAKAGRIGELTCPPVALLYFKSGIYLLRTIRYLKNWARTHIIRTDAYI